jgi:GAF domain-containing protein
MPAEATVQEEIAELRARVKTLETEVHGLELDRSRIERDRRRLLQDFGRADGDRADLAKLFVLAHRLHSGFDRDAVLLAIEEVVASILGCEQFAVFEFRGPLPVLMPTHVVGVDRAMTAALPASSGVLKATLATGTLHAPRDQRGLDMERISACVPLKADGRVTGLLVLFGLLDHKRRLEEIDRELLDLLSHHAGSALYASSLHAGVALAQ